MLIPVFPNKHNLKSPLEVILKRLHDLQKSLEYGAPYSKDFCKSCNRLRITSRGDLRLCLFGNTGISIRHLLQKNDQIEELQDLILGQMKFKKESHYLELGETGLTKNLSTTGG